MTRDPVYQSVYDHETSQHQIERESEMEDRKDVLLRACLELLRKQENSHVTLSLLEEAVFYDGTDCDGYCLMEDIENVLRGPK